MAFRDVMTEYMELLHCNGKELAKHSGLSPSVISRYRAGERAPGHDSEQLHKLARGFASIACQAHRDDVTEESVYLALAETLPRSDFNFELMTNNLNELISVLNLNLNELARHISYDASYISRIRAGQRRPSDPNAFVDGVCQFVIRRRVRSSDKVAVASILGITPADIEDERAYYTKLKNWLYKGASLKTDHINTFLTKLDDFDLNEYIRSIKFDKLKVPTVPFQFSTSKNYYGIEQMKEGELDFFKATVLSRSKETVFMCSNMEMKDMAEDIDFGKKWMFAIAMTLKKGLHLDIIHNLDRPFNEMMLGLESWIPIYMTGQISPYYFTNDSGNILCHLDYVSGAAALSGECISGAHGRGKYHLTKNKDEVAYYRAKSQLLLKKAQPLMKIFRQNSEKAYRSFISSDAATEGTRHGILSSPPLYTLGSDLLESILTRCNTPATDTKAILEYAQWLRTTTMSVLENNTIFDEIPQVSEEEFAAQPVVLSLGGAFIENDIYYNYDEYIEHLNQTKLFAAEHPNYTAQFSIPRTFSHIQIIMHEGSWVMISKSKSPAIHFVIRHPKLREALENFVVPVTE